jgi:hypothetical protein
MGITGRAWILIRVRMWSYSRRGFRNDMTEHAKPGDAVVVEGDSVEAIRATAYAQANSDNGFASHRVESRAADRIS